MSSFTVESWTWYGFAITMVALRFTARLLHFKTPWRLQVEDWLMLFIACLYTILITFLNIDATVETNLIDPADIPSLTPQDIAQRTWGSKMVLLVEQCMCAVQWGTKACLLILYWRLTQNLTQNRVVQLVSLYVLVTYLVMEVLYFAYWCRPFHDYWQTPTDNEQCTTALHHLILNLAFNLSSDLMIMSIPIPLLLKTHMELGKKLLLTFPFSLGLFTIVCAILSKHLSFTQPFSGDWVFWYCREASTAMIVTNMPYSWSLIRRVFRLKAFLSDGPLGEQPHDVISGQYVRSTSLVDDLKQTSTSTPKKSRTSRFFSGRKAINASASGTSEIHMNAVSSGDEKHAKVMMDSSSTSGESHVRPTTGTAATLDKLYPLGDEDLERLPRGALE